MKKFVVVVVLAVGILLFWFGVDVNQPLPITPKAVRTGDQSTITIMTFNVENLFDTKDDPGKNDATYLPLELKKGKNHIKNCKKVRFKKWQDQCLYWDWNGNVVAKKIANLGAVVKSVNNGRGPDVLLLQEVENKGILERLNEEQFSGLGYTIELVEGKDLRGIDVALMTRLPVIEPGQLSYVNFRQIEEDRKDDTRGILQTTLKLPDSTPLTVFVGHFPAPFHPVQLREDSLSHLKDLLQKLPQDRIAVAGGDFNIPREEDAKTQILSRLAEPFWLVAHKVGCKTCRGTNYYSRGDTWSFLDVLMVSKSIEKNKKWKFDPQTVKVVKHPLQTTEDQKPKRFSIDPLEGVSDHWPLLLKLQKVP